MMIHKKRMLLLAVVCGLSGCNLKTNETVSAVKDEFIQEKEPADSQTSTRHVPVIVKQGKESIDLYELIVSQKGYSKKAKSWVVGDGAQLSNVLSEAASELPLAVWGNDFEVQIPENHRFYYMDVFDENYEKVLRNYPGSDESDQELKASEKCMNYLKDLSSGTYYVSIAVVEEGKYIESEGQQEYTVYEYAFRLDKDMPRYTYSGDDWRQGFKARGNITFFEGGQYGQKGGNPIDHGDFADSKSNDLFHSFQVHGHL